MLSIHIVQEGAKLFRMNVDALRFIGGLDSSVYESVRDGKACILKFKHISILNIEAIRTELDFIIYLGNNGVDVAMPLASINNKLLEVITENGNIIVVTAFDKAFGKQVDFNNESEWNSGLFYKWGKINGQIHSLSKNYIGKFQIKNWHDEFKKIAVFCPDSTIVEKWENINKELSNLPRDQEVYGLIHNDMHPWNFSLSDSRLTVFDFGNCIHNWFINDIAIALYWAVWAGPVDKRQSLDEFAKLFMYSFMGGYSSENTLDNKWLKRLPLFLKNRQLFLYIFFTYIFNGDAATRDYYLKDTGYRIVNDLPVVNVNF